MAVLDSIKNIVFGKPMDDPENLYEDGLEEDPYFSGSSYEEEEDEAIGGYAETRNRFRSESRTRRTSLFHSDENDGYAYETPTTENHSPARIVLVKAKRFSEVKRIAENLKQDRSVVINFEEMDRNEAQRTLDFLSGTVFAKGGDLQKLSRCTIIFAVGPVDLIGRIEDIAEADNYFDF